MRTCKASRSNKIHYIGCPREPGRDRLYLVPNVWLVICAEAEIGYNTNQEAGIVL
jgi:hypothetical protein